MCAKVILDKLEVQITSACNFSCFYCGNNPVLRNEKVPSLNYSAFKKCVDELNPKELVITGGEPGLVLEDVKKFFTYSKNKGIQNTLTSNLSLFNKEDLKELVNHYGVSKFNSSFNDLNSEMSAMIRGACDGDRNTICENISYITQGLKKPLRIETLLLKETIPYICEIEGFLYDLGLRHHALEFLNPHGYAGWNMMTSIEDLVDVVFEVYKHKKKDLLLELTCNYISPCNVKTEKIYKIKDNNFKIANCFDGKKVAYLLSNGRLIPCFMYSGDMENNNVNNSSPAYIFEHNPIFKKVKNEMPQKCATCSYYYNEDNIRTCNNGCWAMMLMETQNLKEVCCEYVEERIRRGQYK